MEGSGPKIRPADSDEPDKTGKTKGYAIKFKKKWFLFKPINPVYFDVGSYSSDL